MGLVVALTPCTKLALMYADGSVSLVGRQSFHTWSLPQQGRSCACGEVWPLCLITCAAQIASWSVSLILLHCALHSQGGGCAGVDGT